MKIVKEKRIYFFIFLLFFGLIYNVGPIGEIYSAHNYISNKTFIQFLLPKWQDLNFYILNPIGYYLDYGYAKYLFNQIFLISLYKTLIVFLSFCFYLKFFENFLSFKLSLLLCFIIFLSPNSDSLIYSSTHRYLLGSSIVLFSYSFVYDRKYFKCLLLLILSIFICYISIIFIFGFLIFFLIKRKYYHLLPYAICFVIFVIYYFLITFNQDFSKFVNNYEVMLLFNKTVIIFFSYIDAGIGISYFIKIFSTINQYTFQFLFIFPVLFFLIIYFFKNNELIDDQIKFDHVVIFFLISIASVGVFILSFGYPFIVFGLGNRTNLFINTFVYSLLIYAFVKYKSHRIISLSLKIFFSIILTSGILISAHWKSFSKETETVVNLIEKNCTSISNNHNNGNILIFFSGYRYSKLDKFDHVEFLAPPWVLNSFCDLKNKYFFSLSNEVSFSYDFKTFENNKYNIKYKLSDYDQIYIFDLNNKNIKETNIDEILRLNLATHDKRHWYFYSDKLIKIIKKISNGKYG